MNKKFLAKVILATVLVGGVHLLPLSNLDVGNIQIAVAYAESKNFAAKEGAMTDVELIETQAKEASRMRAIEAVKEKIAAYVRNFSGAKGKLSEDDIAAIAEKFEQVGETKYKKLFYNAVDEEGKELGKVGIMYEATVTAKFNSKKIMEHIKLTEQEKAKRIRQARESRAKFEELDREYEELRKNARTKTPEQLQSEIKDFDDKISDLEKSRGKNKSAKKDKPKTKQDKIQPMKFSNPVEIGMFGWTGNGGIYIKDATYVSEQPKKIYSSLSYSKGVARFGDGNDALYLHYDKDLSPHYKLGSQDIQSTIIYDPVDVMRSSIFKVKVNNGYKMYLISKNYDIPEPRKQYVLIGQRPDGKWVKYFDTEDFCQQYIGKNANVAIQKIIANGDTIIAKYARCNYPKDNNFYASKANEFGEFRFKWDEAAKWFGVEKITYNQTPTEHKTAQENKAVTNQPMQFSQPVKLGRVNVSQVGKGAGGYWFNGADSNEGIKKDYHEYDKQYIYSKGVARYGNSEDALYIYYDESQGECNVGGKDIKNTQKIRLFCDEIYKITTNRGIVLYPINFIYGAESRYKIIGRQKDGKWVKYIDTNEISKTYFGTNERGYPTVNIEFDLTCKNDMLIMQYRRLGRNRNKEGEFRFKWDDKAQWFSVEQVKY